MPHISSKQRQRSIRDLVEDPVTIALLHAVAGRRITGSGQADWLLDGQPVEVALSRLAIADRLITPGPGPLTLSPRGRLVLAAAHGEIAMPVDEVG